MNGPSLATRGSQVAVTWYTEARDDEPRVLWALSRNGGKSFAAAQVVDDASPIGRSDVAFLEDGSVIILWMAKSGETAELRVRRYHSLGKGKSKADDAVLVTAINSWRSSGFPRLASFDNRALVAWTVTERQGLGLALLVLTKQ